MTKKPAHALQREILPIPDRPYSGTIVYDARDPDAKFPPIELLRPPAGAPNIMLVLLDDVGFGAASALGGPCTTTTAERLAKGGLTYTRFHTTALCSPTRAALLTGRNHHNVGMGGITEIATSAPGYTSAIPNSAASIAKILNRNGYATAHFGECHEVPVWEATPAGPFDRWPTGNGFDKFYGFVAGETSQWFPEVYDGTTKVDVPHDPEYHFMADMTDRAIEWIRMQKSITPDKPFFAYFAPGATHAPHHVPKEWADQVRGPVRRRLGRAARAHHRAAEAARRHPRGRHPHAAPCRDPGLERHARRAVARAGAARWRSMPGSWNTRTTTSAGCSTPSRTSGSWRTRWSSTSSATTAPRPRAPSTAASTR